MKRIVSFTKMVMVLTVSLSFIFSQVAAQKSDLTKIVDPNGPNFEVKGELDCPDGSMLDQSAIGYTSAANSDEDGGYLIYQPFSGVPGDILSMSWWSIHAIFDGGWATCVEDPMDFEITFYEDDGGNIGTVTNTFNESLTGFPTGELFAGVYEVMRYEYTLSSTVSLSEGWVSISSTGGPDCWGLWLNSGTINAVAVQEDLATGVLTDQEYSMSLCLVGDFVPVDPPENLTAEVTSPSAAFLEWEEPASGAPDSYNIYKDGAEIGSATTEEFTDENLAPGTYEFCVTAVVGADESVCSNTVSVTIVATNAATDLTLELDGEDVVLNWTAPGGGGGDLVELVQHDGTFTNAYYQAYDNGYGVVYDISAYPGCTIESFDFRHSSWGFTGIWDYKLHIVDWDTYTEITVIDGLQTTGDDQWEDGIPLGSIAGQSGLVGVFLEPMSNDPADAYPCIDGDNNTDGMSYNGALGDYSAFTLSTVGDFLMDLWIMTAGDQIAVKPPKVKIDNNNTSIARAPSTPLSGTEYVMKQTSIVSSPDFAFLGYNVYHRLGETGDFTVLDDVTETTYTHAAPGGGHHYYYVTAVYDEGESDETNTVDVMITGINDIVLQGIDVYPNPATDVVNISSDHIITSIEVYNYTGQLISDNQVNNKMYQINTSEFNTGVYFFQIETTEGKISKRIIIE